MQTKKPTDKQNTMAATNLSATVPSNTYSTKQKRNNVRKLEKLWRVAVIMFLMRKNITRKWKELRVRARNAERMTEVEHQVLHV
jgi:hypothetical protein